ncbi:MAG: exo-alpha-sialidase [Bacteroidales bacterium]|nr:exo-alpha-sialidase [Bacteroidales bacterium]
MKQTVLLILLFLAACTESPFETEVFVSGTEGYSTYRIPAIVSAPDGTLLAFAEGRKDNDADAGDIDLILKRSTDGGRSWGKVEMVWDDCGNTCGNPAPVFDKSSGRLLLMMTWNLGSDKESMINTYKSTDTRRVFYTYSDDIGKTWSTPADLTSVLKDSTWSWYATGPCHAIQKIHEPAKGRIVVSCNHNDTTGMSFSHVIWTDDCGENWQLGGSAYAGGNESTVAELEDGRLLLNMRKWKGVDTTTVRRLAYSTNAGETWSETIWAQDLIEPVCQGSMLSLKDEGTLLFSNPHTRKGRKNMTISRSTDGGLSWDPVLCVNKGKSAYSDMTQTKNGSIGLLYEYGTQEHRYAGIRFRLITEEELK